MAWLPGLLQLVVLFGGTLAIIFIDKAIRKNSTTAVASFTAQEPGFGVLVLLTFLCNIAALPYYFYQTRGKGVWALVGFALFIVCSGAAGFAYFIGSLFVALT